MWELGTLEYKYHGQKESEHFDEFLWVEKHD